ncbi:MAG: hydrogenase maturation nickel metallochaperone HypA [Bauldia sp.]|nr:hydrogenase maturation nickel metallochaperone HypA [Bauldia sp.]
MHEHALIADLVREILRAAEREQAKAVTGISVWLGALSHMSPDHFAEHFEDAAVGTIAEGAEITAEVSDDIDDPRASSVLLTGIEVEAPS